MTAELGASTAGDSIAPLSAPQRAILAALADRLIPAAHGMPSAAAIVDDARLRFVLKARPDLAEPLAAALRAGLPSDPRARLDQLGAVEPATLAALQLVVVAAYYTDRGVRERIGYPGQEALTIRSWELPVYLEEGLIDAVLERGPTWRDPATGVRAVVANAPRTYAERWSETTAATAQTPESVLDAHAGTPPEGGTDGHDRA